MPNFDFDGLEAEIPHLRRFARSLTHAPDQADDLVQDTLERAISRHEAFEPGSSLRAWLFTILRNRHIDQCRTSQRRGDSVDLDTTDARLAVNANQHSRVEALECTQEMAELPKQERDLLMLVAIDGVSYDAAAEIFGVETGTVKSRLNRTRAKLRAHKHAA